MLDWNTKGFWSGSSDTSIDRQREAILVRGARTPIIESFVQFSHTKVYCAGCLQL